VDGWVVGEELKGRNGPANVSVRERSVYRRGLA
jgi:hypothetical protein